MRTHGWGGRPPVDDDEAVRRIRDAARRSIDRLGSRTSLADVARELGVTRQTVYRYFPSTDALLADTSLHSAGSFLDALEAHLAAFGDDPAAVVVEAVAHTVESLPSDPYVGLLLQPDRVGSHGAQVTSEPARVMARTVIDRFPVDWDARSLDDTDRDELAEHLLRLIQSFVLDPGEPPRTGTELRRYLNRWVAPAIEARVGH